MLNIQLFPKFEKSVSANLLSIGWGEGGEGAGRGRGGGGGLLPGISLGSIVPEQPWKRNGELKSE